MGQNLAPSWHLENQGTNYQLNYQLVVVQDFVPSTVTFTDTTPAYSTSQQAPLANCTSTEPPLWLRP